jgi:hypothetical protein
MESEPLLSDENITPVAAAIPVFSSTDRLAPLKAHLEANYHAPDLQAIEIVLCAVISHYYVQADPCWLFLEGRSRGGKTSCGINPLTSLPNVWMVGDLSPKTFLSGWKNSGKGKKSNSLLQQIGQNGILLFKDFTTLMSKRPEHRAEIVAQLRELHDGRLSKSTGMGEALDWSGKITVIAAVTQAIEREWALLRDLGERFLTVRYRSDIKDDFVIAEAAQLQRGSEREIAKKLLSIVAEVVDHKTLPTKLIRAGGEFSRRLSNLAQVVAVTRARVVRDSIGARNIVDIPDHESPSGIVKSLAALVSARAALYRRDTIIEEDINLAAKVAMDSIPRVRAGILEWTPLKDSTCWGEFRRHTKQAPSSLKWHLDELLALDILHKTSVGATDDVDDADWAFTDSFREMWSRAFPNLVA